MRASQGDEPKRERYVCTLQRNEDGMIERIIIEASDLNGAERSVSINGFRGARVSTAVHELLRSRGITAREWASGRPIALDQVTGAQAELLIAAVSPLHRTDRVERIARAVAEMSREEASYWHAKSRHRGGLPALRTLLEGRMR